MASASQAKTFLKTPRDKLRAGIFYLSVIWIITGPLMWHMIKLDSYLFIPWRMFSGSGIDLMDVTYYTYEADGSRRELDRFEALGLERDRRAYPWLWAIVGEDEAIRVAQYLCGALGEDADVRLEARRATRDGWVEAFAADENLCVAHPPLILDNNTLPPNETTHETTN